MRSLGWSLLANLVLVSSALGAVFTPGNWKNVQSAPGNTVPNKYIVEVKTPSLIPGKRDLDPRAPHEELYSTLRSRDIGFRVNMEFNREGLFVGAVVTLSDPNDREVIADLPGVEAIRPVIRIPAPAPIDVHVVTGGHDPHIPPDTESTHIVTGVDKLHAQGVLGNGVKIGIIDTGIDYTHPSLGGAFGPGHKVIGGFDFVGDAYTGANTPIQDSDPLDQCNGHGTHVAGIIGADPGNMFNISGVAYKSSLSAYRVFGCSGSTTDDIIIAALLRGVSDGNDILTLSLGGTDGWTEGSASVVASRIAATGKIVTIAAGNDGAKGAWYTSSPGNAINAISVASTDNTVIALQNATVNGVQHDPITYFSTFPFVVPGPLPIYATNTNTSVVDDSCAPLPSNTPDLSPFLVVVRRGGCTFVQKLQNIADKGGKFFFIYDNGAGFAGINAGDFNATLIQAADGVFLVNQFAAGANITISFPQSGASTQFPDPDGGLISAFTSLGPSNDMFFKPAVAAPGGNILSTLPVPLGSFGVLSGTSMATPFMAGVSALLFEVKGKSEKVGLGARDLFETTAQKVPASHNSSDLLQSAAAQGAGLVDAFKAIHTDIIVSPGEFLLNDTAFFKKEHTFTVKNTGKKSRSFKVTHKPAGTMLTLQPGTPFPADQPVPLSTVAASVKLSMTSFTVEPGKSQKITATFTPPSSSDVSPALLPVISGFIEITGTDKGASESFHVTYLGVAAKLRDANVVDMTDKFFGVNIPALGDSDGNFIFDARNFTFIAGDFPTLVMRLNFGTPLLRVDLVTPTVKLNSRDVVGRESLVLPDESDPQTYGKNKIVGNLLGFAFLPRNSDQDDGTGYEAFRIRNVFSNGTQVPNGNYRILLRALKVTGDPNKEEDFESWLSPIVGVDAPQQN